MKATITLASFLLFNLVVFSSQATVFSVNNNPPSSVNPKPYENIQDAHDDFLVKTGDTLMIAGSPKAYGRATLGKRLVLIGPGYFLTENPQTQANPAHAVCQGLTLQSSAAGTIIKGLTFSIFNSYITISANDIIIARCYFNQAINLSSGINNIQILQNYFAGSALTYFNATFTNIALKNNIIGGILNIPSSANSLRLFSMVENNIFLDDVILTAITFHNNIIFKRTANVTVASSNIRNNLVSTDKLGTTNGNQIVDPLSLFVGPTGNSPDGQYRLQPGSSHLTAGVGGTQAGIFGGTTPYMLSGIPPLPTIYEFSAESFGTKQSGLPISIKVKAN